LPTPIPTDALSVPLTEALSELHLTYTVAGRSPQTTQLFTIYGQRLIDFLAAEHQVTTVDQVTTGMVTAFIAHEQARGLKPASISVILRTLRRFFQFCVERDHITKNPAKAVMAPSVVVEPVRFLDDQQLDTLLKTIARDRTVEGVRDTAMVRVLMDTGMRRGELIGLTTASVDMEHTTLTIRAATSKTRRGRTVPFSQETAKALKTYLRVRGAFLARNHRDGDTALWISAKGALSANGALQALRRRLAAAGLPQVTMHSLRHGMAARAIERGLPMPYLVKIGGWANATMPTSRYGQFQIESRANEAMKALLDR
jgi:site-specific recombinase XerD